MLSLREVESLLADRNPQILCEHDPGERFVQATRLDEISSKPVAPGRLYVGYLSAFRALGVRGPGSFVLARDEEPDPTRDPDVANVLLVDNTDDLTAVFGRLDDAIRREGTGEGARERLLSILLHDDDLSALAQTASELVGNPILVTDSSYNIVAHSTHATMDDAVWATGWQRGYLTFEFIGQLKGAANGYFERDAKRPCVTLSGISEHRRRIYKLVFRSQFIGYLVILEDARPLDETTAATYSIVRDVLSKQASIEGARDAHTYRDPELNLLGDLLAGRVLNRLMFRELVGATSFRDPARYQVLCLDMRYSEVTSRTVQDRLRREIGEAFAGAYSLFLEDSIVVLLREGGREVPSGGIPAARGIRPFLEGHGMAGGLSEVFEDLYDLPWHSEQSRQALRFGEVAREDGPLFDYDRYRGFHLLSTVPVDRLERFCQPEVLRLAREDGPRGGQLFDTLVEYLRGHMSVTETARRCYVHRNTVAYRLERLREEYGLEFDDPDRILSYETSCAIIRYLRVTGGAGDSS